MKNVYRFFSIAVLLAFLSYQAHAQGIAGPQAVEVGDVSQYTLTEILLDPPVWFLNGQPRPGSVNPPYYTSVNWTESHIGVNTITCNTGTEIYSITVTVGGTQQSTEFWEQNPSDASEIFYDGGNVGIGLTDPTKTLDVNGNTRIRGNLQLNSGGYLDDDGTFGGTAGDDWLRFNSYIELKTNHDSHGIVLREKASTNGYMSITQKGGWSYLADNNSYNNYFLRGNGANAQIRGTLTTGGTISTPSHGTSTNWKSAYDESLSQISLSGLSWTNNTLSVTQGAGSYWSVSGDDIYYNGDLRLKGNAYIDDDSGMGGNSDDWIRLNSYVELSTANDSHGIVLREKGNTNYMSITQKGGWSYLADNTSYSNYFLRGNGANAQIRGTLTTGGTITTPSHGTSANWKIAYDQRGEVIGGNGLSWNTTTNELDVDLGAGSYWSVSGDDIFYNGDLRMKAGAYLDDDSSMGGTSDDWIKFSGYIEMRSNSDNYGILLRDKDATNYLGMTQKNGYSYFADSQSSGSYFLRGNGRDVAIGNNLTVASNSTVNGNLTVNGSINGININTPFTDNLFIGENSAGSITSTAERNAGFGARSAQSLTTGDENVAIGVEALSATTIGPRNVAVGYQALDRNVDGEGNVAIGYQAGPEDTYTNLDNTVAIGYQAKVTSSNQVRIGNYQVVDIGGTVSWSTVSDGRFKSNLKEDVSGLNFINKLRPVSYNLDQQKISQFNGTARSNDATNSKAEVKRQIGFVAQEVEKVVHETGFEFSGIHTPENEKDHYTIRYAEFVVPLTKAVQELSLQNEQMMDLIKQQQEQIAAQQEQLELLLANKAANNTDGVDQEAGDTGVKLLQNKPNPFSSSTRIEFKIDREVKNAELIVYDLKGNQVRTMLINNPSKGYVDIEEGVLGSGMYIYALIVDGHLIGSKKMIVKK